MIPTIVIKLGGGGDEKFGKNWTPWWCDDDDDDEAVDDDDDDDEDVEDVNRGLPSTTLPGGQNETEC